MRPIFPQSFIVQTAALLILCLLADPSSAKVQAEFYQQAFSLRGAVYAHPGMSSSVSLELMDRLAKALLENPEAHSLIPEELEAVRHAVSQRKEVDLMSCAQMIARISPRASALFFGMLGPHLRYNFIPFDWIDIEIMPVLLNGFMPYLHTRLKELRRLRRQGDRDKKREDEALHLVGLLINGLMFVPGNLETYFQKFTEIMKEAKKLGVKRPLTILREAMAAFPEDFPLEISKVPRGMFHAVVEKNDGTYNPIENSGYSSWDVVALHPKAQSYFRKTPIAIGMSASRNDLKTIYQFFHTVGKPRNRVQIQNRHEREGS